jgi:hypothetical protein
MARNPRLDLEAALRQAVLSSLALNRAWSVVPARSKMHSEGGRTVKESPKDAAEGAAAPAKKRAPRKKSRAAASPAAEAPPATFADREVPVPEPMVIEVVEEIALPYEEVSMRAYFIFLERGGTDGDPFQDWLQAERDVRDQRKESNK